MSLFVTFFIITLILFIPIPIKIRLEYLNKDFKLKLFNCIIFSSKIGIENKLIKKIIIKRKKNIKRNIHKKNLTNKKLSFKKLYKNINSNKMKPRVKLNGYINYGVEDAALCALLYGLLCNIPSLAHIILQIVFKVKNLALNINPKFNTFTLSFGITSIFYFNIVNIIYISYSIIKSMEIKEVAPN